MPTATSAPAAASPVAQAEPTKVEPTTAPVGGGDVPAGSFRYEFSGAFTAEVEGGEVTFDSNADEHIVRLKEEWIEYTVGLFFPLDAAPGTYPLDAFQEVATPGWVTAFCMSIDDGAFYATAGTLTVDAVADGLISGSFEFQAAHSEDSAKVVTVQGEFNQLQLPNR